MLSYLLISSTRTSSLYPFFFNDTSTTEIYTLSLHDALPIWVRRQPPLAVAQQLGHLVVAHEVVLLAIEHRYQHVHVRQQVRSEEHTSELQSRQYLVCSLLLEKKQNKTIYFTSSFP